jgi:tRNA A37 threonylcarbamoyladenosine biosynthesis protein TsaE
MWEFVKDKGIEVVEWSEEDAHKLSEIASDVVPEKYFKDEAFKEIFAITKKWAIEQGYWDKK